MNKHTTQHHTVTDGHPSPHARHHAAKTKLYKNIMIGCLAGYGVLIAGFITWLVLTSQTQRVMSDRYQAVFLEDGKVFFGKLQNTRGDFLTLNEAYYTQGQEPATNGDTQLQPAEQVNLVKVGQEVYGPEGGMAIRADQILFWQNLAADSQIVKAIESQAN